MVRTRKSRAASLAPALAWPVLLYCLVNLLAPTGLSNNQSNRNSIIKGGSILSLLAPATIKSSSSSFVICAQASSLYQELQDRGIIILDASNFNTQLIQHQSPFPHVKLAEYYLPYSRFCAKFRPTFMRLAKEIHSWRNVIRLSAIDLGHSNNSPIAHSWSIETVPTLRIHPVPNPSLAETLYRQFQAWNSSMTSSELQKLMFGEYTNTDLMIESLNAAQYMDKSYLLKSDLIQYIGRYISKSPPNYIPSTWPNLHPVKETSLRELVRNHPRQELFLIVELTSTPTSSLEQNQASTAAASSPTLSDLDQSSSSAPANLALSIMMELSSSAAWKAIRYVRAHENRALIDDISVQLNKTTSNKGQSSVMSNELAGERAEPLEVDSASSSSSSAFWSNDNIVLIHIDDAHPSIKLGNEFSSAFSAISRLTAKDLDIMDSQSSAHIRRAKRLIESPQPLNGQTRNRRWSMMLDDKISSERKIELISNYIRQTYTETNEDREFVKAIESFDETYRPSSSSATGTKNSDTASTKISIADKSSLAPILNRLTSEQEYDQHTGSSERFSFANLFNFAPIQDGKEPLKVVNEFCSFGDYADKLKAIRYMLTVEIVRSGKFGPEMSIEEQLERLNILVNLVTVIKSYFPLPDSSSVQFVDGIKRYLLREQSRLSQTHDPTSKTSGLDSRALKQEVKRLESEEAKRLPEIKEYKFCKTGYPCALWRLFHTLAAFEYKKLSQVRQHQQQLQSQSSASSSSSSPNAASLTSSLPSNSSNNMSDETTITMNGSSKSSNTSSSQVERLVSPPSTTTSLSLTISASPSSSSSSSSHSSSSSSSSVNHGQMGLMDIDGGSHGGNNNNRQAPISESDLPRPVILVMRDYITNFFSCEDCAKNFRSETADLSPERIRGEVAEFSLLKIWEIHNNVNKRLSVSPETNPKDNPKVWFPTYDQCSECYAKQPSFLTMDMSSIDPTTMFSEPIEWNRPQVLEYLLSEYTKQPMDNYMNIFGYKISNTLKHIAIAILSLLVFVIMVRWAAFYLERQRRHKANLLYGDSTRYSIQMQSK